VAFARVNPLSNASDLIRSFLLGNPPFSPEMVISVMIFSAVFTLFAAFAYIKLIQHA
jgi:ABC-type polysaccharide/polyol phosphate export permease